MLNLNMFRTDVQAAQPYAELQAWATACRNLGADPAQLAAYENAAQAYATTTIYPNSTIVYEAREAAHQALQRGEPLPKDPEEAIQAMWNRQWAARLNRS
jgi:hypothetical protein